MKTYPERSTTVHVTYSDEYKKDILSRTKCEYEREALKFLFDTQSVLHVHPTGYKSMPWDKEGVERNTCVFDLLRGDKHYTADFGLSIYDTEEGKVVASAYDILSCLKPFMDCGDVDEFFQDYDYEKQSDAIRAFEACKKEADTLASMYTEEELDRLSEIC